MNLVVISFLQDGDDKTWELSRKQEEIVSFEFCNHGTIQLLTFSDKGYLSCEKKNLGKNLKLLIWYKFQMALLRLVTVCGRGITREYIRLETP